MSASLRVEEVGGQEETDEDHDEDDVVPAQSQSANAAQNCFFRYNTYFQPMLSRAMGLTKVLKKIASVTVTQVTVRPFARSLNGQISHG